MAKVGQHIETVDVEKVLPVATTKEKRMRFTWETPPSTDFLMNWNHRMEPNSMFVEDISDTGIVVTLRWGLLNATPEKVRDYLNNWLAKVEGGSYRRSGVRGAHL
ncbi:MAG: hypothetical protein PCFJNLEI_02754 [Verrucomicrobiae bacterium]|nr:hypothetical protein [Verrucomicrobiae bacterium]